MIRAASETFIKLGPLHETGDNYLDGHRIAVGTPSIGAFPGPLDVLLPEHLQRHMATTLDLGVHPGVFPRHPLQ